MENSQSRPAPLFSLVMPVYNAVNDLDTMLESILSQSFTDYEVILVDDGSSDGSSALCDAYAEKHDAVTVIHQANAGSLQARRRGEKASRGRYILNVDADDLLVKNALEILHQLIAQYDPDLIFSDLKTVDQAGNEKELKTFSDSETVRSKDRVLLQFVSGSSLNSLCIKCIRRELMEPEADYSEFGRLCMADDELLSVPCFEKAETIVYSARCLYIYRLNNTGLTSARYRPEYAFDSMVSKKRKYAMIRRMNLPKEYTEAFSRHCVQTVNAYSVKAALHCGKRAEFADFSRRFRKSWKELDLSPDALGMKDRLVFFLVRHESYRLLKLLGKAYLLRK